MAEDIASDGAWHTTMRRVVDSLPLSETSDYCQHEDLRIISAAISMLVHHEVVRRPNDEIRLINNRRKRTSYSSYPTSPAVSEAIAQHLRHHLMRVRRPITILDPTIEGGPLLLECAHVLAQKANVKIVGIDRSIAAIESVDRLFERAIGVAPKSYLRPILIHGDALATMDSMDLVDAVVNNPPWGERSSQLAQPFLPAVDPCYFFVERALKVLRPGGILALVLPGQVATSKSAASLRKSPPDTCTLSSVTTLPTSCFPRATVRALLLLGVKRERRPNNASLTLVHYRLSSDKQVSGSPMVRRLPMRRVVSGTRPWWKCASLEEPPTFQSQMVPLSKIARIRSGVVPYRAGRGVPRQTSKIVEETPYTFRRRVPNSVALVRSKQVKPFICLPGAEYVRLGPHLAFSGTHATLLRRRRIFVREMCSREGRLVAAPAPNGVAPRYGVFSFEIDASVVATICAVLNSAVIARYVASTCDGMFKESFNRVRVGDLRNLPIPKSLLMPGKGRLAIERACRALRNTSSKAARTAHWEEMEMTVRMAYGEHQ